MKSLEERFPVGCYVVMKQHQKKYSYYISDELKVVGHTHLGLARPYNNHGELLILDNEFCNNIGTKNTIHPDNVELSKRWLREKKIEFLFNI